VAVGGVVSSLAIVGTLIFSILDLSSQRRAERDFKVTQEIVSLTKQLSSDSAIERRAAALLLASYEHRAIDLLTSSLVTNESGLPPQIIYSLRQVMDANEPSKEAVIDSLILQTKISLCVADELPFIAPLYNYLDALEQLLYSRVISRHIPLTRPRLFESTDPGSPH